MRALLLVLLAAPSLAQATRADLAARFVVVDGEIGADAHEGARWRRANELFDKATFDFFKGDLSATARTLVDLRVHWNEWDAERARSARGLTAVRVALDRQWGPAPSGALEAAYAEPDLASQKALGRVVVTDPAGEPVHAFPLTIAFDADGLAQPVPLPAIDLPADCRGLVFSIFDTSGGLYSSVHWSRSTRAPSAYATGFSERAGKLADDALADARAAFLSRCALLVDEPDPERTAEFLQPPYKLLPELRAELAALEAGRDPYVRRPGGLWRTFALGRRARGFYVHAPAAQARSERPAPLVVALHGAGADEMFFPFAVGGGHLVRLAEEHGFLLACPRTADVSFNARGFDALVETLAASYAVDRDRIYVLGHSMGAMAAAGLTQKRGEVLAGAVCIAGARELGPECPTLLIAFERDGIVPAAGIRRAFEAARAADIEVEYEVHAGGHTLPLGHALTRAIDWCGLAR